MPIINFSIPTTLDKKIDRAIKENGFTSKAEFFRFSAMRYLSHWDEEKYADDQLDRISKELTQTVVARLAQGNVPPLEEQLKDL